MSNVDQKNSCQDDQVDVQKIDCHCDGGVFDNQRCGIINTTSPYTLFYCISCSNFREHPFEHNDKRYYVCTCDDEFDHTCFSRILSFVKANDKLTIIHLGEGKNDVFVINCNGSKCENQTMELGKLSTCESCEYEKHKQS